MRMGSDTVIGMTPMIIFISTRLDSVITSGVTVLRFRTAARVVRRGVAEAGGDGRSERMMTEASEEPTAMIMVPLELLMPLSPPLTPIVAAIAVVVRASVAVLPPAATPPTPPSLLIPMSMPSAGCCCGLVTR